MHYIKGQNNILAVAFSQLDQIDDSQCLEGKNAPLEMPCELEQGCNVVKDAQMFKCILNLTRQNDHGKIHSIITIHPNSKLKTRNFNN